MFVAINKTTGQRIKSWNPDFSEDFMKDEEWYADPLSIEGGSVDLDKSKIVVKYRRRSDKIINRNGTVYDISPHFYVPNLEVLGIKTRQTSEEHQQAVDVITKLFSEDKIKLIISSTEKQKVEFKINSESVDSNLIDIEENIYSDYVRRADILIPLKKEDFVIGSGIVIELQLTPQTKYKEDKRSFDRATSKFSVVWLSKEDYENIKLGILTELQITSYRNIITKYFDYCENKIKELTINYTQLLEEKTQKVMLLKHDMRNEFSLFKTNLLKDANNLFVYDLEQYIKELDEKRGKCCPFHNVPLVTKHSIRTGKDFLSCPTWKETGCNGGR